MTTRNKYNTLRANMIMHSKKAAAPAPTKTITREIENGIKLTLHFFFFCAVRLHMFVLFLVLEICLFYWRPEQNVVCSKVSSSDLLPHSQ